MVRMCGRFTLRTPLSVLARQFAFDLGPMLPGFEPRYNIAPTQDVPAVRLADGNRQFAMLRWGLIPSWAKDAKLAQINARGDTVATKPMFRTAYKKRRCLVLADGYYEWERSGKTKLPWLYEVDGGKPFAFAGLWESWRNPAQEDAELLESCTILTTDANELAAQVHDRMPVILDEEDYADWLAGEQIPLVPFATDRMTARPVSTFVNNARNQGPACVEPREVACRETLQHRQSE
jgi:putative SOS response-associated peptidase YedK